jgi:hypothetical protein
VHRKVFQHVQATICNTLIPSLTPSHYSPIFPLQRNAKGDHTNSPPFTAPTCRCSRACNTRGGPHCLCLQYAWPRPWLPRPALYWTHHLAWPSRPGDLFGHRVDGHSSNETERLGRNNKSPPE